MQAILVEQEIAPIRGREIERLQHDDRVGRAHLHAQLAELAGVELKRERLRVVPLLGLQHLDLDDLRRAGVIAPPAAAASLLAPVLLPGQEETGAEALPGQPAGSRVSARRSACGRDPATCGSSRGRRRRSAAPARARARPGAPCRYPPPAPRVATTNPATSSRTSVAGIRSFHEIARIWST